MNTHEFAWAFILGAVCGRSAHATILQIGYRLGIVEYERREKQCS